MKRATLLLFLLILSSFAMNAQGNYPYNLNGRQTCIPANCTSQAYPPPGTYVNNYVTENDSCFYGEFLNIVPGSYVYNCVFPTVLGAQAYLSTQEYYENGNWINAGSTAGGAYTYDIIGGNYVLIWQMSVVADCFNDTPRYYKQPPAGC